MAIKKVYELSVDLKKTTTRVNVPVLVQGDSAEFRIRLLDDGNPLSTEQLTGITAVRMQSGYDAQTVIQTVGTLQGSVAVFRLKKNELFRSGTVQAMVQLEDSADRISTLRFQYQVIPDLSGNYIPGEQDITVFQRYMNDAQAKIDEMAATDVAQLTVKLAETIKKNTGGVEPADLSQAVKEQLTGGSVAVVGPDTVLTENIVDNQVTPYKTNFAKTNNLFNGKYDKNVGLAGSGYSNIVFSNNPNTFTNAVSVVRQIEKSGTFTVSKSNDTNRFGIALFIGPPQPSQAPARIVNLPGSIENNPHTFTAQGDEDYVVIYVSSGTEGKEPAWLQFEKGKEATKPNAVSLNLQKASVASDAIDLKGDFQIVDNVGNYKTETSFIPRSTANSASLIYAEYDKLMNESGGYITKELLGNEKTGLPVYLYKFRPSPPQNLGVNFKNPKIFFISGTHGQEDRSILETLRFFSDMVKGWKNNEALMMLRWNVDFDVIPVLNPYGVNNKQRKNANGVDINRNMPKDWVLNPDTASTYYGGTAPLTEIESQLLDSYLKANRNELIFAVDYHKYNTLASDGHAAWMGTSKENVQKVLSSVARLTNAALKADFPFIEQSNANLTSISPFDEPGVIHKHFTQLKIPGIILETVWNIGGVWDEQDEFYLEENSQRFSVDLIGNLLLTAVRQYKALKI